MITRTTGGVASTLSYDALDHLVHWDGHAGTSEDYLYDGSGERVLRRAVKSTGKEIYTYPFGLMDIRYSSSGVQVLENDYYTLAGRLIGEQESGVTVFLLTDELGSVLTSISAVAGSAAVTSNQAYSPYGTQRYRKGAVPTDKGFTGQYLDDSGLNYYNARYYDPVVGRFVSADTAQGNGQGMDPYSYVGNNPETRNDPTGQRACNPSTGQCGAPCGGNCSPGSGNGGGGNPPSGPPPCHGDNHPWCDPDGGSPPSPGGGSGHTNPKIVLMPHTSGGVCRELCVRIRSAAGYAANLVRERAGFIQSIIDLINAGNTLGAISIMLTILKGWGQLLRGGLVTLFLGTAAIVISSLLTEYHTDLLKLAADYDSLANSEGQQLPEAWGSKELNDFYLQELSNMANRESGLRWEEVGWSFINGPAVNLTTVFVGFMDMVIAEDILLPVVPG